jgi:hypothetical protein
LGLDVLRLGEHALDPGLVPCGQFDAQDPTRDRRYDAGLAGQIDDRRAHGLGQQGDQILETPFQRARLDLFDERQRRQGRRRFARLDGRDEPIASAGHGGDVLGRLRIVVERAAQGGDMDLEIALDHRRGGPGLFQQFLLAEHLAGTLDEGGQQVQGPAPDANGLAVLQQQLTARDEHVFAEGVGGGVGHGSPSSDCVWEVWRCASESFNSSMVAPRSPQDASHLTLV